MSNFEIDLLVSYAERFANRQDVFAKQFWNAERYWYEPVHESLSFDAIRRHLKGVETLGWYSHSLEDTCKWLVVDFDDDSGNLTKLAQLFRSHQWECHQEGRRDRRDGHLWLFFDEPVSAFALRQLAGLFLKKAGIPKVEVFPKQDSIKGAPGSKSKLGNLVRGPLGIHRKPGAGLVRGWFEDAPPDIEAQLKWLASQKPNKASSLLRLLEPLRKRQFLERLQTSKPVRKIGRNEGPRINWALYAQTNELRLDGSFWRGACPACRRTGNDTDGNHLWITDRGAVGCWRECSLADISTAARANE